MRILNEYSNEVFWRAFRPNAKLKWIGLKSGKIASNKSISWHDDSFPKIKVEIKKKNAFSKAYVKSGQHFKMGTDLIFTADKELVVARVNLGEATEEVHREEDVVFRDLRNTPTDIKETITSRSSEVFSAATSVTGTSTSESTWSVEGKIGGKIKKKKMSGKGELSAGWSSTVSTSMEETYASSITKLWSIEQSQEFTLSHGLLHQIKTEWEITTQTLPADYFGETGEVTLITKATASGVTIESFEHEQMLSAPNQARFVAQQRLGLVAPMGVAIQNADAG